MPRRPTGKRKPTGLTLAQLITEFKGDRSFEDISRDGGGVPAGRRIQQLATRPIRNFPDPDTINSLARGLGVTPGDVINASARSLGIYVGAEEPDSLTIPGAGDLPPMGRDALLYMGRALVAIAHSGDDSEGGTVVPLPRPQSPATNKSDHYDLAAFIPEDPKDGQD